MAAILEIFQRGFMGILVNIVSGLNTFFHLVYSGNNVFAHKLSKKTNLTHFQNFDQIKKIKG